MRFATSFSLRCSRRVVISSYACALRVFAFPEAEVLYTWWLYCCLVVMMAGGLGEAKVVIVRFGSKCGVGEMVLLFSVFVSFVDGVSLLGYLIVIISPRKI